MGSVNFHESSEIVYKRSTLYNTTINITIKVSEHKWAGPTKIVEEEKNLPWTYFKYQLKVINV